MRNPIGFGASDFVEFTAAVLLALFAVLWNSRLRVGVAAFFAAKTVPSMAVLFALPIVLRMLLLPNHPVPVPEIYDEFSQLLSADTLLHFRFANPVHPLHQFFETFFVLQTPAYSSIYPIGQGLVLAFGRLVSGCAWTGVVLVTGALCACCYWMLRAWTTPVWALFGGLLAVVEFGPLCGWMNSYWGGALAALAGCLVFGALPRLLDRFRTRDAIILGGGFGLHLLTRQFESTLLLISVVVFFGLVSRGGEVLRKLARSAAIALIAVVPAIVLTLVQNKAVTQSWTTIPEELSQYQYGVPTTLTVQLVPIPHHPLTAQQELDYKAQSLTHGPGRDTVPRFLVRLLYRVRYYRFFFLPALYPAVVAFLFTLRERRFLWAACTLAIFALGTNLFPYLLVHYLAAVSCLFILVSVVGLRKINDRSPAAARVLVGICALQFVFWYGLHLFENAQSPLPILEYETWDAINHREPHPRVLIKQQLLAQPGKHLVFVRYWPQHIFQDEWVWNAADIDASPIVFARDLGPEEDEKLIQYYRGRKVWLLEPDFRPPRLTAYQ